MAGAVARGLGASLLPDYACADGLASGDLVEVYPVGDLVPAEPWFAVTREADVMRSQVPGGRQSLDVPGGVDVSSTSGRRPGTGRPDSR